VRALDEYLDTICRELMRLRTRKGNPQRINVGFEGWCRLISGASTKYNCTSLLGTISSREQINRNLQAGSQ